MTRPAPQNRDDGTIIEEGPKRQSPASAERTLDGETEQIASDATLAPDASDRSDLTLGAEPDRSDLTLGAEPDRSDLTLGAEPDRSDLTLGAEPDRSDLTLGAEPDRSDLTLGAEPDRSDLTLPAEGGAHAADDRTLGPNDAEDPGMTLAPGGESDDSGATVGPESAPDDGATLAPGESPARVDATALMSKPASRQVQATAVRQPGEPSKPGQTHKNASQSAASAKEDRNRVPQVAGYEMMGELGRGGMGVVYRAKQVALNRVVALKMVLNSQASDAELDRFRLEARAVALVQHPGIVQVYDVGEHKGLPYFSLEFVAGGPLDSKLKGEPQDFKFTATTMEKICRAMGYAHSKKIIHRDLKPANILLTKEGEPKVTDFGLAKEMDSDEGHTRTGSIMGTPSYMPPEQAEGQAKTLNHLADIYSLGAMMYEFLTGRPPFKGRTLLETLEHVKKKDPVPPVQLQPDAPIDLQTICLKALEKDPAKRYQSAEDMADDLAAFSRGDPIKARPISLAQKIWRWSVRNKAQAALVAVGTVFIIATLLGSVAINGLYAVAENQRKAAERRRDNDRSTAQKLLDTATNEAGQKKWSDARQNYENALTAIRNDAELADMRKLIEEGLAIAEEHVNTDAKLSVFREQFSLALYELTGQSGRGEKQSYELSRLHAKSALSQFQVDPDGPTIDPVFGAHFSEKDKPEILRGCSELLVVLADTWSLSNIEKSRELLEKARREAKRAGVSIEKAYFLKMARYTQLASLGKDEEYLTKAKADIENYHTEAAKVKPSSAYEYFLVGDEEFKEQQYDKAAHSFQQALLIDPNDFFCHFFLGICHLVRDQYAAAQASFLAALSIRNDFQYTNLFLGVCAGKMGDFDEAERLLADSKFTTENRLPLLVNRAVIRYDHGDNALAIDDLQAALKIERTNKILVNLATVYFVGEKRPEMAEPLLREAMTLNPNDPRAPRLLAKIIAERADSEKDPATAKVTRTEAIALLRKAIPNLVSGTPEAASTAAQQGLLLMQTGDLESARAALTRATVDNRSIPKPWLDRGQVAFALAVASSQKQGKPDTALYKEAIDCFDQYLVHAALPLPKGVQQDNENMRAFKGLALERKATAMMILNDSNGALAAQSEAVVADPNQASLRRNRGWNLMNGWRKLALADFEAGLKTDQGPNRADLLLGRSYLLAMEGKIDEALASEADYTKVSDGKPAAMLNYGTVYAQAFEAARRSGNTAKADDLLKRLLKLLENQTMRFPEKVRANAWAAFQADEGFDPIRGIPAFVELNKKLSAVPPSKPTAP